MRSLAVGRVLASRTPGVEEGEHLYGWFGWQDYAAATADRIMRRVDPDAAPLSASLGVLGLNGVTALLALRGLGRPVAGETIVVSTAAGGVGSIVGQLAREAGLRTIGLTGDDAKVGLCREDFGYDAVINYRSTPDLAAAVAQAAPEGIDIFFDNTGGAIADAVFPQMRVAGRVIQCGTASVASWSPAPQGPRREREMLTKRLSWGGFVIFDHLARFAATADELQQRLADGRLRYREQVLNGIEEAPGAIERLYSGDNVGRLVIRL
jgi:NADPH-dependent curcumin reductase CurA